MMIWTLIAVMMGLLIPTRKQETAVAQADDRVATALARLARVTLAFHGSIAALPAS